MKRQILILVFSSYCFLCSAQQTTWVSVKGFLPRWNGAEISILTNNQVLYSSKVVKDIFDYTAHINVPRQAVIKLKSGNTIFYTPFFLEPGTIKIRDGGGKYLFVYGTSSNDSYIEVTRIFDSLTALQKIANFKEAIKYKRELAGNFIRNNTSSVVSLQLLKDYYYLSPEADDRVYHSLINVLDANLQKSFYGQEMWKEANQRFLTTLGNPAPNLQLNDTVGKATLLFKTGEYTLIDFWASWCIPCRRENTELIKVFKKYRNLGFSITSISLDNNKFSWVSAIRQDKMPWKQLSDLRGWESAAATTYGVKLVPMNYLVNREGLIVAKNVQANQLNILLDSVSKKVNF